MGLDDCYKKGYIRKIKVNSELIKSLIEMSDIKEKTIKSSKLDEINVSAYFSMAYDSLREILEAVSISRGFKVTSHLCLGELLKNILDEFDFVNFDRFRYARNSVNYYGTKIDFIQGKELINKIFEMKKDILKKFLKEYNRG